MPVQTDIAAPPSAAASLNTPTRAKRLPATDHDLLIQKLTEDNPQFTQEQRQLLQAIVEDDINARRAWAVYRFILAGHGKHADAGGAYRLAAAETHCSPSTARRAFTLYLERHHEVMPLP